MVIGPQRRGLFRNPLPFEGGSVLLPAGYWPELDTDTVEDSTQAVERYVSRSAPSTAAPLRP